MSRTWGRSVLEGPRLVYTRRWERWLAVVWPPRRRKLVMMNRLAAKPLSDTLRLQNQLMSDVMVYGTAIVTSDGTRIPPIDLDQQNPGSEREARWLEIIRQHEADEKL